MAKKCSMCKMAHKDKTATWVVKKNEQGKKLTTHVCDVHAAILNMGWIKKKL